MVQKILEAIKSSGYTQAEFLEVAKVLMGQDLSSISAMIHDQRFEKLSFAFREMSSRTPDAQELLRQWGSELGLNEEKDT